MNDHDREELDADPAGTMATGRDLSIGFAERETVDVDGYPIGYLDGLLYAEIDAPVSDADYEE